MTLKAGEEGPAGVHRVKSNTKLTGFFFCLAYPERWKSQQPEMPMGSEKRKVNKDLPSLAKEPGKEQNFYQVTAIWKGLSSLLGRQESWECFRSEGCWER